jgi:hypothetical protein
VQKLHFFTFKLVSNLVLLELMAVMQHFKVMLWCNCEGGGDVVFLKE